MASDVRIRVATPADAAAVRTIYAPFCESTAVTFEETPPSEIELADRIESTLGRHPWLVCEDDGEILGYAYAGPLRERRAYDWIVELSVYVADATRRSGIGRALYESLFAVLERQGIHDAYAVTTVPNPETERFHEALGFDRLVEFPAMGHTDGEWWDVAWWRRPIAEKPETPERVRALPAVREDDDWESLVRSGEAFLQLSS
ncbi:GNAT family N-acetyltransferase [Natrinema gelatinilyticum]|uniref:GNAT family N-acetyltransferase n=1 Tax=Natrinema gelatinilyticum TaxID=2961571 RepID=UPI0020C56B5B|nr:GNAT family N-acetyltransferase [Natrinema gelatinilyticum]